MSKHRALFAFLLATAMWTPSAFAQEPPKQPPPTPPAPDPAPAPPTRAQQMRKLSDQLAAQQAELDRQKALIEQLQQNIAAQKPSEPPKAVAPPENAFVEPAEAAAAGGKETVEDPRKRILIYGYVQGQFQIDKSSQDVIAQDGRPLNQDRFLIPRARLVAEREWKLASVLLELDGNTLNGPAFGLQRAEASILYRGHNEPPLPPMLSVTLGQFRVPFGAENLESPAIRYFLERSLISRSFFPTEIDLGLRVAGAIGWFRYSLAAMNGHPIGSDFQLNDTDSAKDVGGRLGVQTKPVEWVDFSAGVSSIVGKGFHQEPGASKTQVQWIDVNGDGIFQPNEAAGIPAVAARPSSTFKRFGLAFDASAALRWQLGEAQLSASVYLGNNMDRGLYIADPTLLGRDSRHFGYALSALQEIGKWIVVGGRVDYYNPDSDASDYQNAAPVQPYDRSIRTWSPIVGIRYQQRARLMFEYDIVRDKLARDERGVPTDLSNDRMTLRLQVNL